MTDQPIEPTAVRDPLAESTQQEDYWGFEFTSRHVLPDGVSFFEIKAMNEGARAAFQKSNNQDMRINRRDDTASVRLDPVKERHALIQNSVVGWNLKKGGEVVDFAPRILEEWLKVANPRIVDDLEHACRLANPWLTEDMSVEDIDKEIDRLRDLREQREKEDAAKAFSSGSVN